MAAPRSGLTTSRKPSTPVPQLSGTPFLCPSATLSLRRFGYWAAFGAVIDECPFPVWHRGFPFGLQCYYNATQTEPSEQPDCGLHRACAALKRPGPIHSWHMCFVMEIKGKQQQSFRRSPRRLKDNSDDSLCSPH